MSEYQYYEFQALDRPLREAEQAAVAKLSSRVEPSSHRAVFTYSYGDFRGDPEKVLEKYFDAMLYLANWGSRHLVFRFPRSLINLEVLAPYCVKDLIVTSVRGEHVILCFYFDEEEGGTWVEGEGWLDSLVPLREQILEGDLRVLYLAWLKANEFADEDDEDSLEPPVPPNLRKLSKPLQSFVELFEVNEDLIDAAAEASPDGGVEPDLENWIPQLSEREQQDFLRQLVRGDSNVEMQLRRRLRELARQQQPARESAAAPSKRRTFELVRAADERSQNREEEERRKKEQARTRKLNELALKEPEMWNQVMTLIAQKKIKAYDEAVTMLKQLRELAEHRDGIDHFNSRIQKIQEDHKSLSGLRSRLQHAGLAPKR